MGLGLGPRFGLGQEREREGGGEREGKREMDLRAALVVSAADAAHEIARDQLGRAVAQRRVCLLRARARLGPG